MDGWTDQRTGMGSRGMETEGLLIQDTSRIAFPRYHILLLSLLLPPVGLPAPHPCWPAVDDANRILEDKNGENHLSSAELG